MSIIGLDVGTSRVKAVRFDDEWRAVDVESCDSEVERHADGRREQDMQRVWQSVCAVLTAVAGRSNDPITLVAATAQGDGCWLIDAGGDPIAPAMLWNDNRAADIVRRWQRDGLLDEAFRRNGCFGSPGIPHAQLAWLRESRPDILERATTLLSCGSWVHYKLTGRRVLDVTDAANPFLDARSREYAPEILDLFGLRELERLLPALVDGARRVAPLRPDVAERLGLPDDVAVAAAPYDVPATATGIGAVSERSAFAVLGTTLCVGTITADPLLERAPNGLTLPAGDAARWLVAHATMIGTEVLDWAAGLLGLPDAAAVSRLAAQSSRHDLPLVLPYFSPAGERSPFLDPSVRATITGIDNDHTPSDIARAVIEGLAMVIRDCLEAGENPDQLKVCGGGARSDIWCQAVADAIGRPVVRPALAEVGAFGAALTGSVDAGIPPRTATVTSAWTTGSTFAPDPARRSSAEASYQRFRELRDLLRSAAG